MNDKEDMAAFMAEMEANGGKMTFSLGPMRRAIALAREDGRDFAELSADAQEQYLRLARSKGAVGGG